MLLYGPESNTCLEVIHGMGMLLLNNKSCGSVVPNPVVLVNQPDDNDPSTACHVTSHWYPDLTCLYVQGAVRHTWVAFLVAWGNMDCL